MTFGKQTHLVLAVLVSAVAGCSNNLPPPANAPVAGSTPITGDANFTVYRRPLPPDSSPLPSVLPTYDNQADVPGVLDPQTPFQLDPQPDANAQPPTEPQPEPDGPSLPESQPELQPNAGEALPAEPQPEPDGLSLPESQPVSQPNASEALPAGTEPAAGTSPPAVPEVQPEQQRP
jgi:hypothetical protein